MPLFLMLGPAANAPGCTAACRLIVQPEILYVPTCTTRCPAHHNYASDPSSEMWNYSARNDRQIWPETSELTVLLGLFYMPQN
jgi:hypothetical protein